MMTYPMLATLCLAICASAAQAQDGPGQKFMSNWDLDGDGAVTLSEARAMRENIFAAFDSDEDGNLSSDDYDMFDAARANDMASVTPEGRAPMRRVAGGLKREVTDLDHDGTVTLSEFLDSTAAWHEAIDTNGDGVVTPQDFGQGN
ncbi:Ca2+-binding EF-hand superfamily protein [Roseovarius halotolerans]|uniref:Transaldolase/EF-hand domain-containing protein n=2 Tax=Roseovarius halotolerans TaxID=505353 RepID=A0A1X6ZKB5_9RHOB|nr:Ca2+-binding EF-hand superfamily protein [Roseovarius halotolerans]SLN51873.1 transaldolase/EF-hand domain-containing protein [Roseovarius halotolerans]